MTTSADSDQIAKAREQITERAHEAFKCDMCAGSGQIMFYGRNFGPCTRCKGAGYDIEAAAKGVQFAASERQAVIEECRRKLCVYCNNANSWNPATNGKHAYKFGPDERFCDARAIRSMGE